MPIPTPQEIEAGFESRTPGPTQAQDIIDVRNALVQAAQFIATKVNDNRHAKLAINAIQNAFSNARSSIMLPPDVTP